MGAIVVQDFTVSSVDTDSELLPWLLSAEVLLDCVCLPGGLWVHPPGDVSEKQ